MAGRHYYKLNVIFQNQTELLDGEYFTGLLSYFIPNKLLQSMKSTFEQHNIFIEKRIENGQK